MRITTARSTRHWTMAIAGAALAAAGYLLGAGGANANRAQARQTDQTTVEPEIIATPFEGAAIILYTIRRGAAYQTYIINSEGGVLPVQIIE